MHSYFINLRRYFVISESHKLNRPIAGRIDFRIKILHTPGSKVAPTSAENPSKYDDSILKPPLVSKLAHFIALATSVEWTRNSVQTSALNWSD